MIDRYLKIEGRLYSSEGEKRGQKNIPNLCHKKRERKHRPSQDLREDDNLSPFIQVKKKKKKSEIQSGDRDCYCSVITVTTAVYQDYSVASKMVSEGNKTQRVVPCPFF